VVSKPPLRPNLFVGVRPSILEIMKSRIQNTESRSQNNNLSFDDAYVIYFFLDSDFWLLNS
jgi:hypothetical protein